jgi:alkylhydroperoxidase family enzyme
MQRMGVSNEKIEALWSYQASSLFDEAERAAFDFALAATAVPNAVTEEHFVALHRHYCEEQIVELLATIGYVAYLNKWNDSMATPLEQFPSAFAKERFKDQWSTGKHER